MVKAINWLTRTIIQVMLIVGLTIYLTWVTVHTYVDKLLTKYNLNTVESKINFSDFLTQMSVGLNILKPSHSDNQAVEESVKLAQEPEPTEDSSRQVLADPEITELPAMAQIDKESEPVVSTSPKPTPTITPNKAASTENEKVPDDSISVFNQTKKDLVISAEEFTKKKDEIKDTDKVKIFTLLATRLPQNEFQQISTFVEDGVTEEEWVEIQKIVEEYLKPAEYKELQDLLAQY